MRFIVPDRSSVDRFRILLDREPEGAPPDGAPLARDVAVLPWPVDPLLALRLVESGVHQVAPTGSFAYHELADRPSLRRRLGLRWDGDTATFLRLIETLPDRWWFASGDDRPTLRLASRLARVCQDAVDVAGLPMTPTGPPTLAVVRRVICRLWHVAPTRPVRAPAGPPALLSPIPR